MSTKRLGTGRNVLASRTGVGGRHRVLPHRVIQSAGSLTLFGLQQGRLCQAQYLGRRRAARTLRAVRSGTCPDRTHGYRRDSDAASGRVCDGASDWFESPTHASNPTPAMAAVQAFDRTNVICESCG